MLNIHRLLDVLKRGEPLPVSLKGSTVMFGLNKGLIELRLTRRGEIVVDSLSPYHFSPSYGKLTTDPTDEFDAVGESTLVED